MAMAMALRDDGELWIKNADNTQFTIIKSWNLMRWDKANQMLRGPATAELLNRLASITRLTPPAEAERQRLNGVLAAVDRVRMMDDPSPIVEPPVKMKMFKHQTRGYVMALLTFGLINPEDVTEEKNGKSD